MSLASFEDANQWLDRFKIEFDNAEDASEEAEQADAIVKGHLYGTFPDHVNLWDIAPTGPQEATPELVVQVASMLMASYRYAKRYSEEELGRNNYANQLEQRAMKLLQGISDGTIDLADKSYLSAASFEDTDFWPNDATVKEGTDEPLRAFTMEQVF